MISSLPSLDKEKSTVENVKAEEEEEPGPVFTDDEEQIVQYLKEDEPLPADILDKIVPQWWNDEPFRYHLSIQSQWHCFTVYMSVRY